MSTEVSAATVNGQQETLPPHIKAVFGKPPVLSSENYELYEFILLDLAKEIRPQIIVEWEWIKDLADLIWIIRRYRLAITSILEAAFLPALKSILESTEVPSSDPKGLVSLERSAKSFLEREYLADQWYRGPEEQAEVSERLAKYNLDANSIAGQAFVMRQREIRALEMLIERAELRRDRILREIVFYRENLAETLDPLTRKLIDENLSNASFIPQQSAA